MANSGGLPARFEIRRLGLEDLDWAKAIIMHSTMFCSPIWPAIYPDNQAARVHKSFGAVDYLMRHQIESGMSFGVFDTEYKFKRSESAVTGGALYWDEKSAENGTREQLLEQMDFPLVSIALSYDGANPLDHSRLAPLFDALPLFPQIYQRLGEGDRRDPAIREPKGPRELLKRNGTATRDDYQSHKLMKTMARWLMKEAASVGYKAIQIESFHDAVTEVWMHPPDPFKAELISEINIKDVEEEVDGKLVSYHFVDQRCAGIHVTL